MEERRIHIRPSETPEKKWPLLVFGKKIMEREEFPKAQKKKIGLFEKGLETELRVTDTIEGAVTKIVKMALAAEFGPSLVKAKGATGLINTIVRGIMSDSNLRRQALLIMDRFAH